MAGAGPEVFVLHRDGTDSNAVTFEQLTACCLEGTKWPTFKTDNPTCAPSRGEASARLSLALDTAAVMDCRLCEIPTPESVVDYFRWRADDAHRNALSAHCYWALRREGLGARRATERLSGLSVSDQNELLFERGNNYNDLPAWQKRGVGLRWEEYEKEGFNPKTGEAVTASRRRVARDMELPMGDEWTRYLEQRVEEAMS